MNFDKAQDVQNAVQTIRLAVQPVMANRTKINALMDGDPPLTETERVENKVFTNFNSLEGTRIIHAARGMLNNASERPAAPIRLELTRGDVALRVRWSQQVTNELNRMLKRCPEQKAMFEVTNAQVTLHGIGPSYWSDAEDPIPTPVGIEDVLVPSGTLTSLQNMGFFAIYREWTYPELYAMTHGPSVDEGWDMEYVEKVLEAMEKASLQPLWTGNRWLYPEKQGQDVKENSSWMMASSAPKVQCWDFYFASDEKTEDGKCTWQRRIVIDAQVGATPGFGTLEKDIMSTFLFDSSKRGKKHYATDHRHLIHFQFGNCSSVAPFRYYAVRSLGFLLYAVCLSQNRLRCRYQDAIFESLMMYFRNVGENDRERLEKVDLWHMGLIPEGLNFVTAGERMEVNPQLVLSQFAENQRLMASSSSSYLSPSFQEGGTTPATATEEIIKAHAAQDLQNAMLNDWYSSVVFLYREQVRRMFNRKSSNPMVKEFHKRLLAQAVPLEILDDMDDWDVQPDRGLGGGSTMIETLKADKLMGLYQLLPPQGQQLALRMAVAANSNADIAEAMVPTTPPTTTHTTVLANLAVGTLMDGIPFTVPNDANVPEYITTILQACVGLVQQLPAMAQVPDGDNDLGQKLLGLQSMMGNIVPLIQRLGQAPQTLPMAKQFMEAVKQIQEQAAPFAEEVQKREQEKMQQQQGQQGMSPEDQSKLQFQQASAQLKLQTQAETAKQKQEHKDAQWNAENARKNATTAAELQRQAAQHQLDAEMDRSKTAANIQIDDAKASAEIIREHRKVELAPKKPQGEQ